MSDAPGLVEVLQRLPPRSPKGLDAELERLGYRGQREARRALCLMAYRHVERLRRLFIGGFDRTQLPPRTNLLCMGPTGSGKTYIVELLFGRVLTLPCAVVDITGYSETGYVGGDVHSIPSRLVDAALGDPDLARGGVIVLDEFDKLATSENRAVFAGAETTKDVSGRGVQRELLKMIEGSLVDSQTGSSARDRIDFDSRDVAFVACGAFSGLKLSAAAARDLGFGRVINSRVEQKIAVQLEAHEAQDTEALAKFGFLPELIGRFARLVVFAPLERDTLKEILLLDLDRHRAEFALEGFGLEVDGPALGQVVDDAFKRQTGARGLASALLGAIEEAAYERFGERETGTLIVGRGEKGPVVRFEPGKPPPPPLAILQKRAPPTEPGEAPRKRWSVSTAPEGQVRSVVSVGLMQCFKLKELTPSDIDALVSSLPPHADLTEVVDSVALFAWDRLGRPPPDDEALAALVSHFFHRAVQLTGATPEQLRPRR